MQRHCIEPTAIGLEPNPMIGPKCLQEPYRTGVLVEAVGQVLGVLRPATHPRKLRGLRLASSRSTKKDFADTYVMVTSHDTVLRRGNKEATYDVGLRLAVMALRVEAAIILASGRGGLEVRWNCARGHDDCVMWMKVRKRMRRAVQRRAVWWS
jgi:hypothetical protein